jgi:hypothetical protein
LCRSFQKNIPNLPNPGTFSLGYFRELPVFSRNTDYRNFSLNDRFRSNFSPGISDVSDIGDISPPRVSPRSPPEHSAGEEYSPLSATAAAVPPAIPRPPEQGASDVSDTELFTMEEEEVVMTSPQQQQQQQQQAEDIRASSSASSSLTVESSAVVAKAEGIFF